jgi:hypothetical protein
MYSYNAYELGIHSDLPLPELVAVDKPEADVIIRLGKLNRSPLESINGDNYLDINAGEAYLYWDQIGTFLVRGGKEIFIEPFPGVEADLLRLPLLGGVLATLLHQRGLLVLHASAVALNGKAAAFLGGKGWGKSTLAAVLHARGHSFISDDVVALDTRDARITTVLPAFPRLKLWPDAIASLGKEIESCPRLHSLVEKRNFQITPRFVEWPVPLKNIYILGLGPRLEIEAIKPQEIIHQLIGNSYITRFGKRLPKSEEAVIFLRCAELAKNILVYRLKRPASLSGLSSLAQLVEEHNQ